jgi:bifunctional N-acetylglucosamine-1-phosphate-uridyltransferase/glucosamine-1-phosphate-acetyltransferase GlmU-like protein
MPGWVMSSCERTDDPRPPEKTTTDRGRLPVISRQYILEGVSRVLIVPAAGAGSRLSGDVPKVLVPVAGRPMLDRLIDLYRAFAATIVVVAHPSFSAQLDGPFEVVEQHERTGMLDAVLLAAPVVGRAQPDEVWVTWGDQVGVLHATIERLAQTMTSPSRPAAALPTVHRADPYIHFDRDAQGRLSGLRQRREGDTMPPVGESDMGLFALRRSAYERDLSEYAAGVERGRGTAERNFVPFLPWLAQRAPVATIPCTDEREAIGINTPDELRMMEAWLTSRTA